MAKDKCVMCGEETPYDETINIDLRVGYIEGGGQLCIDCYEGKEKKEEAPDMCSSCNGTGEDVADYPCPMCKGTGVSNTSDWFKSRYKRNYLKEND